MSSRKTAWQHLKDNSPLFVFLLARRTVPGAGVRKISLQEIAIAAGLPLERVAELSWQTDWTNVTIPEAERYLAGCKFDPLSADDRNRKSAYIRASRKRNPKSIFAYLKKSPLWTNEFLPRINLLRSLKQS